jgi:hypothetical protein
MPDHVRDYLDLWRPLIPKVEKVIELAEYRAKRLIRQLKIMAIGLVFAGCAHNHPPVNFDDQSYTQVYTPTPMRDFGTRLNSDLHIIHQGYHGF